MRILKEFPRFTQSIQKYANYKYDNTLNFLIDIMFEATMYQITFDPACITLLIKYKWISNFLYLLMITMIF